MLTVRKFNREAHLSIIKEWTKGWEMPEYPWDQLPDHGWMLYDEDSKFLLRNRPLVCLMMRECEKQTALMDYLISSPDRDISHRAKIKAGYGKLFAEAEYWCEDHGIKLVLGMTQYPYIGDMAEAFGFQVSTITKLWRAT